MSNLREFKIGEIELARLIAFADFASNSEFNKDDRFQIEVKTMYFDYGQDWKYTGLITTDFAVDIHVSSWQSFCPRTHDLICGCDSFEKLKEMADYYVKSLFEKHTGSQLYDVFE